MKSKLIFIDTETTGTLAWKHDPIQIACLIDSIDSDAKIEPLAIVNIQVQPVSWDDIDDRALKVNGITREALKKFMTPREGLNLLIRELKEFIDPFDRSDKFLVIGHNVRFDLDFLHKWAKRLEFDYLGSYFFGVPLDTMYMAVLLAQLDHSFKPENFQLGSVADALGIRYGNLHNALDDILLTRDVYYAITERLKCK